MIQRRAVHGPLRACVVGLVLGLAGCVGARAIPSPSPRLPAAASSLDDSRGEGSSGADGTVSGAEAAAMLRRVALMKAATTPEAHFGGTMLHRVWDDSRRWPEEAAVLDLLDPFLRAQPQGDLRNATETLRADMARSWLARGEPDRARLLLVGLDDERELEARVELTFALDGRAAAQRLVDGSDGELEKDDVASLLALAEARWGDAVSAARQIEALDTSQKCEAAVALADRRLRQGQGLRDGDGDADVGGLLDAAEASFASRAEVTPYDAFGCVVSLLQTAQRLGDTPRIRRAVSLASTWMADDICSVVHATFDVVDPTLLDVPLAVAAEAEAESGAEPWDVCPATMAELAARRGDRRLAQRFLVREREAARDGGPDTFSPQYQWSAHVRLGRADPFARHALSFRVLDVLLVAHILDERPDIRVDRAQLVAALEVDPDREQADAGESDAVDDPDAE